MSALQSQLDARIAESRRLEAVNAPCIERDTSVDAEGYHRTQQSPPGSSCNGSIESWASSGHGGSGTDPESTPDDITAGRHVVLEQKAHGQRACLDPEEEKEVLEGTLLVAVETTQGGGDEGAAAMRSSEPPPAPAPHPPPKQEVKGEGRVSEDAAVEQKRQGAEGVSSDEGSRSRSRSSAMPSDATR